MMTGVICKEKILNYVVFFYFISSFPSKRYIVRSTLGSGTYGTVVKAQMMRTSEIFAIKVMKNTDLQSFEDEVFILNEVNSISQNLRKHKKLKCGKQMQNGGKGQHIIPLVTSFIYDERPCLVFPLMQCSL